MVYTNQDASKQAFAARDMDIQSAMGSLDGGIERLESHLANLLSRLRTVTRQEPTKPECVEAGSVLRVTELSGQIQTQADRIMGMIARVQDQLETLEL